MCLLVSACCIIFYFLDKDFSNKTSQLHFNRFVTCLIGTVLLFFIIDADEVMAFIHSSGETQEWFYDGNVLKWFELSWGWVFFLIFLVATCAEWPQYRVWKRYEDIERENDQLRSSLLQAQQKLGIDEASSGNRGRTPNQYEKVPAWKKIAMGEIQPNPKTAGIVQCPECGTTQCGDRMVCYQCGVALGDKDHTNKKTGS